MSVHFLVYLSKQMGKSVNTIQTWCLQLGIEVKKAPGKLGSRYIGDDANDLEKLFKHYKERK